jgi:hypothetical protein
MRTVSLKALSSIAAVFGRRRPLLPDLQAELIEERTRRIFLEDMVNRRNRPQRERRKDARDVAAAKAEKTEKLKRELGRAGQ